MSTVIATVEGIDVDGDERGVPPVTPADADDRMLSFDAIFTRYHRAIYAYLLGMVGEVEQAQDLTQDTFLKVYTALARTPDPALPAWLYRIATNTARDALRRRRRLTWLPFTPGDEERWPDPAPDLPTRCAAREAVEAVLAQLSPRERACLLLRARDGLTLEEIAQALGLSLGAAKMTLHRAKERFRAAYADTPPAAPPWSLSSHPPVARPQDREVATTPWRVRDSPKT